MTHWSEIQIKPYDPAKGQPYTYLRQLMEHYAGTGSAREQKQNLNLFAQQLQGMLDHFSALPVNTMAMYHHLIALQTQFLTESPFRIVVHAPTPGVSALIRDTEVKSIPREAPKLLQKPWIIQGTPKQPLYDNVVELAGYRLKYDYIALIETYLPDGFRVHIWQPKWHPGAKLQDHFFVFGHDIGGYDPTPEEQNEWVEKAVKWATCFALLLEAEGSPVETETYQRQGKHKGKHRGERKGKQAAVTGHRSWAVRRVYLNPRIRSVANSPAEPPAEPMHSRPGMHLVETLIRGHMRRVPCGPQKQERRWVYIAPFRAQRWESDKPLKIIVAP